MELQFVMDFFSKKEGSGANIKYVSKMASWDMGYGWEEMDGFVYLSEISTVSVKD
ncbi:MAG: hypothetical protein LC633_00845 [Desulfobulbaceae bacterium]|nr:hypothetical protein [Desulfobulbaceae bacterium]